MPTDQLDPLPAGVLLPGETLPCDILDENARVVFSKGQLIDRDLVEFVTSLGESTFFVGHDCPWIRPGASGSDACVKEVISALDEQVEMPGNREGRAHKRFKMCKKMTVMIIESHKSGTRERGIAVSTSDISQGGFSFLCSCFIHPGTEISVQFDALPNKPRLSGEVVHCDYVEAAVHRVGVSFTTADHQ